MCLMGVFPGCTVPLIFWRVSLKCKCFKLWQSPVYEFLWLLPFTSCLKLCLLWECRGFPAVCHFSLLPWLCDPRVRCEVKVGAFFPVWVAQCTRTICWRGYPSLLNDWHLWGEAAVGCVSLRARDCRYTVCLSIRISQIPPNFRREGGSVRSPCTGCGFQLLRLLSRCQCTPLHLDQYHVILVLVAVTEVLHSGFASLSTAVHFASCQCLHVFG